MRYTGASYQTIDADYPKGIPENDEGIPRWNRIGAAFMYDGAAYFFDRPADNTAQTYVRVEAGTAGEPGRPGS